MSDLSRRTVLLVDGMGTFLRHFVANPAVSTNGDHIGGVIGTMNEIRSLCDRFRPRRIYVVWESGGSPRRRAIFPDYKSNRKAAKLNRFYSDDIPQTVGGRDSQVKMLVSLLKHSPIVQLYVPDCEADDVIGYVSRYHHKEELKVILSPDHDYYQLISEGSMVWSPTWKKMVEESGVLEKYGVHPNNFALAKSVCGDQSDCIPGVEGVGFKTLAKKFPELSQAATVMVSDFMRQARSLSESGDKTKCVRSIIESEELIHRNWSLVYLDTANLSGSQITRVEGIIEQASPQRRKIEFIRTMISLGIQTFDADRFFNSMTQVETK
jgi:5'-3' exonuclease